MITALPHYSSEQLAHFGVNPLFLFKYDVSTVRYSANGHIEARLLEGDQEYRVVAAEDTSSRFLPVTPHDLANFFALGNIPGSPIPPVGSEKHSLFPPEWYDTSVTGLLTRIHRVVSKILEIRDFAGRSIEEQDVVELARTAFGDGIEPIHSPLFGEISPFDAPEPDLDMSFDTDDEVSHALTDFQRSLWEEEANDRNVPISPMFERGVGRVTGVDHDAHALPPPPPRVSDILTTWVITDMNRLFPSLILLHRPSDPLTISSRPVEFVAMLNNHGRL